jgi:hypothetical protein
MAGDSIVRRVVLPTLAAAVTTSLIAVLVNFATEWKQSVLAWLGVAALTLLSAGVSVWLFTRQSDVDEQSRDDGSTHADIGRESQLGQVRLTGKRSTWLRTGAKTKIDTLDMTAGDPGRTDRPI